MSRHDQAAGIAGLCFLACALIPVLAYAFTLLRTYGPIWREMIHATLTPQFAAGMFFMAFVTCASAWCIGMGAKR